MPKADRPSYCKKNADYVLALKANQEKLHKHVKTFFEHALDIGFSDINYSYHKTYDTQHGRQESRQYWVVSDIDFLPHKEDWLHLASIIMVKSQRIIAGKTQSETRFYLSSLTSSAKHLGSVIRSHWFIENSLHWVLDLAFREDDSRIRNSHSPENFALLRHIALNLLKREKSLKGIHAKRLQAAWDTSFLQNVLGL